MDVGRYDPRTANKEKVKEKRFGKEEIENSCHSNSFLYQLFSYPTPLGTPASLPDFSFHILVLIFRLRD